MSQMEQQVKRYIQHMAEDRHLSPNTLEAYERDLRAFLSFMDNSGVSEASQVTGVMARHYFGQLRQSGRSPSTVSRHKAALRSYYHYLMREGEATVDPMIQVDLPRLEVKQPLLLTIEQVETLLDAPDPVSAQGIRDRAMLETLYGTGMRITELLALNCSDVHLQLAFVRCVMNQKERVIPLGQVAVEAVNKYMQQARPEWVSDEQDKLAVEDAPLFVNQRGQRMSRQGFWKIVKKYTDGLGWDKAITPYTLRQSFAAHLLNNGAHVQMVQEILGHADASTTQRYAGMLDKRQTMKEVYAKAHPRAHIQKDE